MSISTLNVNLFLFTVLLLLIIFTNNAKISAHSIHHKNHYLPESMIFNDDDQTNLLAERNNLSSELINGKISSLNFWPRTHRANFAPTIPSFDLRRGIVRFYPYKKRTIPLELQKALYAHGIVGRRR